MRGDALLLLSALVALSADVLSARQQGTEPAAAGQTISVAGEPRSATATKNEPGDQPRESPPKPGLKGWISRRIEALDTPSAKPEKHVSYFGGIIVAGSGLAAGVGYQQQNVIRDGIDFEVEGSLSVRRYQYYRAAIGRLREQGSTLEFDTADSSVPSLFNAASSKAPGSALYLDTRFRDYPRHHFYGAGIDSLGEHESDYALRGLSIEGVWQRQLTPALGLSARGGWLGLDVGTGHDGSVLNLEERFTAAFVPGAVEPPGFLTFGAGLAYDTRSAPAAPEDGRMVGVSLRRFAARNAPDLSFTRVTVEARAYERPLTNRGVVAARALLSSDLTGEGGATPFYLQATLGGGETLRGYHSFRFRDQAMVHGTVEYRWRAHRFVELAPFFDVGTVGRGFSRLSLGSLKTSQGIGFRVRTARRALGRLDWAWGEEGQRVVLGTGPAF